MLIVCLSVFLCESVRSPASPPAFLTGMFDPSSHRFPESMMPRKCEWHSWENRARNPVAVPVGFLPERARHLVSDKRLPPRVLFSLPIYIKTSQQPHLDSAANSFVKGTA